MKHIVSQTINSSLVRKAKIVLILKNLNTIALEFQQLLGNLQALDICNAIHSYIII